MSLGNLKRRLKALWLKRKNNQFGDQGRNWSVNWGGGGAYSYIRILPDEFILKSVIIIADFKRNSSSRTRIYKYAPPPLINALVTALLVMINALFTF